MSNKEQLSAKARHLPRLYFSTPVWTIPMSSGDQINRVLFAILGQMRRSSEGMQRSNEGGWHSDNNLHHLKEMQVVCEEVYKTVMLSLQSLGLDLNKREAVIQGMWLNCNDHNHFNRSHVHPNSDFSGVYYLAAPTGCGDLILHDPVTERGVRPFPTVEQRASSWGSVSITPKVGQLVMFPSWLNHATELNQTQDSRVSLSFNLSLKMKDT